MTTAPRRVGVVTVSRSDYGHLRPVIDGIRRAPDLELVLFVGGMHLAPEFGNTVRDIEADGIPVAGCIAPATREYSEPMFAFSDCGPTIGRMLCSALPV